jgi:myo-inositol-1(or 4)-monophosphatase
MPSLEKTTAALDPSTDLLTMMEAAHAAGSVLLRRFRERDDLDIQLKGPADYVTAADFESERTLRSMLLGKYPNYGFLGEEDGASEAAHAPARFIVDPLDGTTNFVHGVPHFAIAIALEREGIVVAGVVFDVPKDEMFVAEVDRGAWRGGQRLRVSMHDDLSHAIVGTGIPHASGPRRSPSHDAYLAQLRGVMREAAGVRRLAAAALDMAYVAAGRFAAYFEFGLAAWDLAAGALLVREAGGRVSQPNGGDDVLGSGDVLATNGRVHTKMLALLRAGETLGP